MKLGVMAYSTHTGLGYQTKSYVKHLNPVKVLHVDLSGYNGMKQHKDWYPDALEAVGYPSDKVINEFLKGLDVVLIAETPLNYHLYQMARERGVKTACVINWEFFDHIQHPDYAIPDMFIMPSTWHYEDCLQYANKYGTKCVQIHHPVDREEIPFVERYNKRFLHIAGKPAAHDRNGTWDFLQACPTGSVVTQSDDFARQIAQKYRNCRVFTNVQNPTDMYAKGDILVFPRKYGGNCLPLNEALASGMPVIMPDIDPNNSILPKEWLVPATSNSTFEPRTKIDIYNVDMAALMEKIMWFQACDIRAESRKANAIADTISWSALRSKYIEALESLL